MEVKYKRIRLAPNIETLVIAIRRLVGSADREHQSLLPKKNTKEDERDL